MSYESEMLSKYKMPVRKEVEQALLKTLFNHKGIIKEFGAGEEIVDEIANKFNLTQEQRSSYLETVYRKENRPKKSYLWHRLLFRAADNLANQKLISRPTQTIILTNQKEWMLTEKGYDKALKLIGLPLTEKGTLSIKSFEVEKLVKEIREKQKPKNYNPIDPVKKKVHKSKAVNIRNRSFRQVIIESYEFKCAICSLKIYSPKALQWEVEAAHIVPYKYNGKDDIWNGLSLCHFHHWAFDVGWYGFDQNLKIINSKHLNDLPKNMGKIWDFDLVRNLLNNNYKIHLPPNKNNWPDAAAIQWHREYILQ